MYFYFNLYIYRERAREIDRERERERERERGFNSSLKHLACLATLKTCDTTKHSVCAQPTEGV